ncbi:MAG: flagellar biosynthesis protein FlhF [Desulfamplus sp.]|nr:flagellar biosynthesis protein FlhF [Desulfamplus sp.]MBF0412298.1 flagellar biosynthesis protein FlhF [Desulfamplus sp.]
MSTNTKTYKARSIQKALADIKEELGSDAMILATRRIPKSPRDPYSDDMFEVDAAPNTVERTKEKLDVVQPFSTPLNGLSSNAYGGENPNSDISIIDELSNIKDLISLVGFGSGMESILCSHTESAGILASLLRAGISEKRSHLILQRASIAMDSDLSRHRGIVQPLKKYVIRECMKDIHTRDVFARPLDSGMPHIAAFVGPTGVGKTTTIAKLAADLSIKKKKRVGLISIDNYRIGAFEQLKAYASIMGLLCIAAFNQEDFIRALKKMESMDVVLIDTAGHSHSDTVRMREFSEVIRSDYKISVHLVLSVTTGFLDMREVVNSFSRLNPETYVFTKVDETRRCGKIFDQINDLQLPVSIITNGQRVPEDLIIPDTRDLLSIMLGSEQSERDK